MIRRSFGPVRCGLISRYDLPRDELARVANEGGCAALLLNPNTAEGGHGVQLRTHAHVAEWDIERPLDEIRAQMKQKWRNRLNRALALNPKVSEVALNHKTSHWLIEMDVAQARQKGYTNWPKALTLAYAKANKSQVRVFEVRQTGEVVSAMMFLCHGGVATYHIGWNGPSGRGIGGHYAALWAAVERLRQRGINRIDLGGIETDRAPGLARFKLGTGAAAKTLGGSWLAVPRLMRGC